MNARPTLTWFQGAAGGILIVLLALPRTRVWLEADLIGHVLAQMPLLALAGWLVGDAFAPRLRQIGENWNQGGVAGLTLVIFTGLFWMLPRSVDGAVQHADYEMAKFMSLPCAGASLALSFPCAHSLVRGALKANLISMLGVLAWLYTVAPVRLCNSYLKSDQEMLGTAMAFLAGALAVGWGIGLFFGPARPSIAGDVSPTPSVLQATSGAQSLS
jgi:hypothetical protein